MRSCLVVFLHKYKICNKQININGSDDQEGQSREVQGFSDHHSDDFRNDYENTF